MILTYRPVEFTAKSRLFFRNVNESQLASQRGGSHEFIVLNLLLCAGELPPILVQFWRATIGINLLVGSLIDPLILSAS